MTTPMRRRRALAWLAALAASPVATPRHARAQDGAQVSSNYRLTFPRDHASHPQFRTEWWYATGWLRGPADGPLGFQITFFRTRHQDDGNPSAFAPRQIMIAHAALSDPRVARLARGERIARAGFGLAGADDSNTHAWIGDWSIAQESSGFRVRAQARDFTLDFMLAPSQPPLLHGANGVSRKGRDPAAASYYYSLPHLVVNGTLARGADTQFVAGSAWLDHEWSASYIETGAVGWDWIGINADDGGALMAFRMRDSAGGARWAGATWRGRDGATRAFNPDEVRFVPRREWRSPRSGVRYPVVLDVKIGELAIALEPLFDDQENDARRSTGTIYWEGAVRATRGGKPFGRGYLELTGYWKPLKL